MKVVMFGVAVMLAASLASANKLCSPTNPCNLPDHCCSAAGICGSGPDFCGAGCQCGDCLGTFTGPPTLTPTPGPSRPPNTKGPTSTRYPTNIRTPSPTVTANPTPLPNTQQPTRMPVPTPAPTPHPTLKEECLVMMHLPGHDELVLTVPIEKAFCPTDPTLAGIMDGKICNMIPNSQYACSKIAFNSASCYQSCVNQTALPGDSLYMTPASYGAMNQYLMQRTIQRQDFAFWETYVCPINGVVQTHGLIFSALCNNDPTPINFYYDGPVTCVSEQ